MTQYRPYDPPMSDPPDTMVRCMGGGPHNERLVKARMLANLSDGYYRKDPACTWADPKTQGRYPVYRWRPKPAERLAR